MDHLTNTPKKLSVKFDNICSVCIVCSCDVSTEKGIRRLASKYKDTLLKLDSEYQDIFTSIECHRFMGKVFLCRKCSLEIQKYIDIEKKKDEFSIFKDYDNLNNNGSNSVDNEIQILFSQLDNKINISMVFTYR